jgi:serine protease Do
MRWNSKSLTAFSSALLGGLAVFAATQLSLMARETNPPPRFNLKDTPVNRESAGLTSYAPVIKRAAPSVVNIYSTRTVRMRRMPMNPFFNDPMFRQFFGGGDDDDNGMDQGGGGGGGSGRQNRTATRKEQSLGSGIIVSANGYILTANHVVDGADPNGVKVAMASGGKEFTAKIIGTDPQTDVAVLKINANDLPAITIADSDRLEVGDIVLAIGNPFGVGQTVTMGMVSALGRTSLGIIPEGYENFIQTDAAINPGNSGGALVDAEGRLIGINTAIFSRSGGYQGVGFAVPVNLARSVMERLINFGKVTRGFLGVGIQSITPELAEQFNLAGQEGALVTEAQPDGPGAKAGIQSGDVIREVNGKKVADSQQLRLMISQMAPGTKVTLKVLRAEGNGKPTEHTVTATLGSLPNSRGNTPGRLSPGGDNESPNEDALDGVEVNELDANVRRQLNIPSNIRGAIVTNVDPESNSAEAGVRVGDVILEINRQPVRNAQDAVDLSKNVKGKRVLLRVWRNGGSLFLSVDNAKSSGGTAPESEGEAK